MQAESILAPAISIPPTVKPDDLEANDPETEYEAILGEAVVLEGYRDDKGVL